MWRKRRLFRVAALSAFACVVIYITNTQLHTVKYRNRRKVDAGRTGPVVLVNEAVYVSEGTKALGEGPLTRHAFNITASDALKTDRSLPDTRHPRCGDVDYAIGSFLTTSVVIVFHNEARSALLRTVVSVLNRTPWDLIEELILVDDQSDNVEDGSLLASLSKVRVISNKEREGLIKSRNIGAAEAKGDFLVFLDSHCEVNTGWLEPLIGRVAQNPTTVACPVIDVIDMNTFQYRSSSSQLKGGFDWSLHFKWIPLNEEEKSKRDNPIEPFMTPAIAGGLFLISRVWFQQLGAFDSGLHIWGAESLEISLKSWLCGGNLEVVPCSRVGHVFRKKHPYTFPDGNAHTYLRNTKRVSEVWLGEHKRFFYEAKPNARDVNVGSLEEPMAVKNKLDCKPFQWFLDNVFPELRLPNEENTAFGQLKQGASCLQAEGEGTEVRLATCGDLEPSQHSWSFSGRTATVRHAKLCLTHVARTKQLVLDLCHQSYQQKWSRHGRAVVHLSTGQCLETGISSEVRLSECRHSAVSQQWDFTVELQSQDNTPVHIV